MINKFYRESPYGEAILLDNYEFMVAKFKKYAKIYGLIPGSLAEIKFLKTEDRNNMSEV